jgi:inhibitor of cysteine peptidase
MNGRILGLLTVGLLFAAAGLAASCSDAADDETPATPTQPAQPTQPAFPGEVQITDSDDGATVQLADGGTLIVALPSNPTTGYSWSVSERSSPQLELQGEPRFVPAGSTTPVVGAGGTEVFTFEAVDTGTATLTLEYRRPFEPGAAPEDTYSVTVEIR